jgi:hypothetical protein
MVHWKTRWWWRQRQCYLAMRRGIRGRDDTTIKHRMREGEEWWWQRQHRQNSFWDSVGTSST